MGQVKVNKQIEAHFEVIDASNNYVTGQTVFLTANTILQRDGSNTGEALTIFENPGTGHYVLRFTPLVEGTYAAKTKTPTPPTAIGTILRAEWVVENVDLDDLKAEIDANETKIDNMQGDVTDILADTNETQTKLPTNNIMGSSIKGDKDGNIDNIETDTDEIQGKLPTNEIMGSSTKSDKDDEIDEIKAITDQINFTSTNVNAHTKGKDSTLPLSVQEKLDVNIEVDNALDTAIPGVLTADSVNQRIKAIDELIESGGTGDLTAIKTETDKIQTVLDDTNETQSKLPTNNIMGSSDKSDKDDEIDAIKDQTDLIPTDPASETNVDANETKIDALQSDVTAIKAVTDDLTSTENIVDAVLNEIVNSTNHFTAGSVGEALTLIRGLVQQNFVLDQTSHNVEKLLTSCRIRIMETALQVQNATDGGSGEGEIAVFQVNVTEEVTDNQLEKMYKSRRTV